MITSYVNEQWDLMDRGTDKASGLPICHIRRVTRDSAIRSTVWRLIKRPNGWHNVGQFIGGLGGYRPAPEKNGKKLSNSRTDLVLTSFAEHGHGSAYA